MVSSVCAGVRQILLRAGRDGFPLHASPFRVLAEQCGASPRELLQQAQALQAQGLLDPPSARWQECVRRQRWRLGFGAQADLAALTRLAPELPCVLSIEQCEAQGPQAAGLPLLWLHLEARERNLLVAQRAQLEAAAGVEARCLVLNEVADACGCKEQQGPCVDLALADALERGLPIVANPYAHLARQLGDRSERSLLAQLRNWQTSGLLRCLSMAPHFMPNHQPWASLLLERPWPADAPLPSGARVHVCRPQPGPHPVWSYRTLLSIPGEGECAGRLPAELLKALGPGPAWQSQVRRLRPQVRLFDAAASSALAEMAAACGIAATGA